MLKILRFILPLISLAVLALVIFQVPPPHSLTEASLFQLAVFFIPLGVFLYTTLFLILRSFLGSVIISIGLLALVALKGLGQFNIISLPIVLMVIFILLKLVKRQKQSRDKTKIPKLTI